jgi:hypothetical protein
MTTRILFTLKLLCPVPPMLLHATTKGLSQIVTPDLANALGAQKYLREAVRLDPKFALSWALLS